MEVNGIVTRYFEAGSGDPLVLIHGGDFSYRPSSSALDWIINFDRLAETHHVYAFDKLGAGMTDSPLSDDQYTMRAVMAHGRGFLDALGLDRVTLVGHSRGGLAAVRMAIDHPDVARSVVVIESNSCCAEDPSVPKDIHGRFRHVRDPEEAIRLNLQALSFGAKNPHLRRLIERRIEEFRAPPHPGRIGEEARTRICSLRERVFMPDMITVKYETLDLIRRGFLNLPFLAVWGFNDPSCPIKVGMDFFQWVALRNPDSEFHVVNMAGHMPHVEQPRAVEGVVKNFLSGRS